LSAAARPEESEQAVERALYLDPSHLGALLHAAALADERGDAARARRLRRRAERAAAREAR
jgi:hypothetical protein